MQRKNDELKAKLELLESAGILETIDIADMAMLNGIDTNRVAPRLFCDICDEFDIHDTEDCPTQGLYSLCNYGDFFFFWTKIPRFFFKLFCMGKKIFTKKHPSKIPDMFFVFWIIFWMFSPFLTWSFGSRSSRSKNWVFFVSWF